MHMIVEYRLPGGAAIELMDRQTWRLGNALNHWGKTFGMQRYRGDLLPAEGKYIVMMIGGDNQTVASTDWRYI